MEPLKLIERVAAIKVGVPGATTLFFKGGRFTIPGLADNILENSEVEAVCRILIAELNPSEDDVIKLGVRWMRGKLRLEPRRRHRTPERLNGFW